ncbi:cupin-like domain-containing protein [Paraglaciecola mesophila]|uniref:Cupin-like domain-containing protein n=1 Tax=Paraglaciecola mesophila TaxID=197222 RepID=A0ABU9SUI5_9ALTE
MQNNSFDIENLPQPRVLESNDSEDLLHMLNADYSPAVIRGFANNWPLVNAAKHSDNALCEYLTSVASNAILPLIILPEATKGRMFYSDNLTSMNFQKAQGTLQQALGHMTHYANSDAKLAVDRVCVQSARIRDVLPKLESQLTNPCLPDTHPFIWLGNPVTVAPHFDEAHNIAIVAGGVRRFTLFPPEQIDNLYIGPIEQTPAGQPVSLIDLRNPDLSRFPKYAEAYRHGLSVELQPGDAIYIPSPWWHSVESQSKINVLVNYWWSGNYVSSALPFPMLIHAIQALKHLPKEQQDAWKHMLEHYVSNDDANHEHIPPSVRGILSSKNQNVINRAHQWLIQKLGR